MTAVITLNKTLFTHHGDQMKRYYCIEFLRLLTSLSVLLYHYRHFFNPYTTYSNNIFDETKINLPFYFILETFYNNGFYGVHMFYAISGFVFAHVYLSLDKKTSSKEFFVNRFARLYPLHFATLILVTIMQLINILVYESTQIVPYNDIYHFILNLFFISSWGFEHGHSFNAPIWSVSVEIFIYGIFFLLLSLLRKFQILLAFLLSVILLIVAKFEFLDKIFGSDYVADNLFLECARLFFSGIFIYYFSKKIKSKNILFPLSVFLIIISLIGNFKIFLFCPSVLLFVVTAEEMVNSSKIRNFFTISGNLTYALYLLHVPIQLIILVLFKSLSVSDSIYLNEYFFIFFFFIMISSSYFCFKYYEKPMNKKIRLTFLK